MAQRIKSDNGCPYTCSGRRVAFIRVAPKGRSSCWLGAAMRSCSNCGPALMLLLRRSAGSPSSSCLPSLAQALLALRPNPCQPQHRCLAPLASLSRPPPQTPFTSGRAHLGTFCLAADEQEPQQAPWACCNRQGAQLLPSPFPVLGLPATAAPEVEYLPSSPEQLGPWPCQCGPHTWGGYTQCRDQAQGQRAANP